MGGSGSDSLGRVLLRDSKVGATLWGRDVVPHFLDVEET